MYDIGKFKIIDKSDTFLHTTLFYSYFLYVKFNPNFTCVDLHRNIHKR